MKTRDDSLDTKLFSETMAEAAGVISRLPQIHDALSAIANLCTEALKNGGKLLFCGNGGSAAESQHLATEFVVRLTAERNRTALPAIALTTDTSLLTACANDFGFDKVFARQVEALMQRNDVLILLSTSGKSANLIEAAKVARNRGGHVVAFLGEHKTPLDEFLDAALHIPARSSQRVQEAHLFCGHLLVEMIERRMMGSSE